MNMQDARKSLEALLMKHCWRLWATDEVASGWMDGVTELLAIVEVRRGKIIKIKGGGYGDYWMFEGESGGWVNISLLAEVKNQGRYIYRVVGVDGTKRFESETELKEKFKAVGTNVNAPNRIELQGQPILQGVVGPMFDGYESGVPVIRYETREAYAMLSN